MISGIRLMRVAVLAVPAVALLAGCAASERQRPIPTSRVATSGDTLEAARKSLEGTWTLVSLEYNAETGQKAVVSGTTGRLVSDGFGNLEIEYRLSDEGRKMLSDMGLQSANPVISTTGRSVIDVDKRSVTYVDDKAQPFDPKAAAGRNNPFALERIRYYDIGPDGILTLSTRYDDGKDAAVSRWKKG